MRMPLAIASMLALGLIGCGHKEVAAPEPEPVLTVESAKVTTQDINELVPIDGAFVLSATDFAKLAPVSAGKIQAVFAKEGDKVKKGQLLAKIDTSVLDAQRSSASASSASASALASQSEASLRAAEADYSATVKTAQLTLEATVSEQNANIEQAQIELDRLKAGGRPQEVSQAQQAVKQAQVNRDQAYANAERDKKLLAEGYVSGQQADASKAAFDVAESALIQAKDQLQLVKLGARPEEVKAAESRLSAAKVLGAKKIESARAALDQAKKSRLNLDAKAQEVNAARLNASGKSADTVAAASLAANGEVRAPFDGVVSKRLLGPGDSADATTPVFEISKVGAKFEFLGQVSPRESSELSVGMSVLSEDAESPTGVIRSIGVADSQSGQVPIRANFSSLPAKVSSGLFVRINVVQRTLRGITTVPEAAIVTREDKKVVFVIESDVAKMVEVEVGPNNNGNVAILKGLHSGQKVVLVGIHELSDGAKVTEAPAKDSTDGETK